MELQEMQEHQRVSKGMQTGCAQAPTQAPTASLTLTPVHQSLPWRRAGQDSYDGKACRLCRGGSPGEGQRRGCVGGRTGGPRQEAGQKARRRQDRCSYDRQAGQSATRNGKGVRMKHERAHSAARRKQVCIGRASGPGGGAAQTACGTHHLVRAGHSNKQDAAWNIPL